MTITSNGGLVRLSGAEMGKAANEDQAVNSQVVERRHTDEAAGWDPYEVWRTRVKAPRDTRTAKRD
jgi:hypothetical protein